MCHTREIHPACSHALDDTSQYSCRLAPTEALLEYLHWAMLWLTYFGSSACIYTLRSYSPSYITPSIIKTASFKYVCTKTNKKLFYGGDSFSINIAMGIWKIYVQYICRLSMNSYRCFL